MTDENGRVKNRPDMRPVTLRGERRRELKTFVHLCILLSETAAVARLNLLGRHYNWFRWKGQMQVIIMVYHDGSFSVIETLKLAQRSPKTRNMYDGALDAVQNQNGQ